MTIYWDFEDKGREVAVYSEENKNDEIGRKSDGTGWVSIGYPKVVEEIAADVDYVRIERVPRERDDPEQS